MPIATSASANVPTGVAAPVWSGSQTVTATVGDSGTIDLSALCAGTGITYSLQAGTLPSGRSLSGSSITGTYTTAQSATYTIRATNAGGTADRVFGYTISAAGLWISTSPQSINLLTTDSGTIDLDTYTTGSYTHTADVLPTGFVRSGARGQILTYTTPAAQTVSSIMTADDGAGGDNFVAAAAEASAYWTERFPDAASVANYMLLDGTESRASRQTTSPPPGATGFMRFSILNTDGTNSGNWRRYLRNDQATIGNGQAYGVRYLYRAPAHALYFPFPGTQFGGPYAGGMKQHIQSWYAGSNQTNEVVLQNTDQRCAPQFYHRNTNGDYLDEAIPATGSDFRFHGAVDNGGAEATAAQRRARYGLMYSGGANIGTPATDSGSFYYIPDVWMVFQTYLEIGTLGTASTRFRGWASLLGQPPKKLWDFANIEISAANGGHNALWLLPYHTLRTGGGGQDTQVDYADVCVAPSIMRWPDGTMPT